MNSQHTSYPICLNFAFILFHTFETFSVKLFSPPVFPASVVRGEQSD